MNGVQTYRNPRLVHVFDKLGLIENFGTGIPRTKEAYKEYESKPEFKDTGNFFIVTLPNVNYSDTDYQINDRLIYQVNDPIFDPINDPINDLGLSILHIIKEKPGLSTIEIVNTINDSSITRDMVKNELKRNLKKYVEHKGSNKTGGYYLKRR